MRGGRLSRGLEGEYSRSLGGDGGYSGDQGCFMRLEETIAVGGHKGNWEIPKSF